MTDDLIKLLSVALTTAHLVVGVRAWRAPETFRAVPRLNVMMLALFLGLCIEDWVDTERLGYPLEALTAFGLVYGGAAMVLSLAHLVRGLGPRWLQWTFFVLHTLFALAVTLFFLTFKLDRLW